MKFSPININERAKLDLRSGDTVRIWQKIQEKGKTRLQAFEGLVIARKHGAEPGATFTVRKIASGIGVEKIFPLYSPMIDKIEVIRRSKVRRAKLYYIRYKSAKNIRRKMKALREFVPVEYQEAIVEEKSDENEEVASVSEKKEAANESPRDVKQKSENEDKKQKPKISQAGVAPKQKEKTQAEK